MCFPAGTPIHTSTGLRPIEDIAIGDTVIAYDEVQKDTILSVVTKTFQKQWQRMVRVVAGGDTLVATDNHPFYLPKLGRYLRADSLRRNMQLLALSGALLTVQSVAAYDAPQAVYNFEVAEQHNYFVGQTGVLVHNDCVYTKAGVKESTGPNIEQTDLVYDALNGDEAVITKFGQFLTPFEDQSNHPLWGFFRGDDLDAAMDATLRRQIKRNRVRAWEVMRETEFALDVPALTKIAEQIANGVPPSVIKQDAIDVLATGNTALRAQWVETLGNPDFIVLRRGTDFSNEREILDESGYILSDAARVRYNETFYQPGGPNMEDVIQYSDNIHQQWLDIFNGDIDAYAQAHAQAHLNGQSLEEIYGLKRTLISTTSDGTEIDNFYTAGVGNKYIGVFERSRVIEQTLPSSSESEFLVVNGTSLLHKIIE